MSRYVTPLAALVLVLLAVSAVTFVIQSALPGDEAEVYVGRRDDLTPQQRDRLVQRERHVLGLDKPLPVQFGIWVWHAARLDFGSQIGGGPVRPAVVTRVLPSLELAIVTLLVSLPLAAWLAVASVRRGRRFFAPIADGVSTVGFVMPQFWLGFLLVILFAVTLHWLPSGGYVSPHQSVVEHLRRLAMPVVTLSIPTIALYYHFVRQSLREALASQYVRTARAKGLSERAILYRHALPNALLPSLTVLGIQFGQLVGGVVVVEQVFNWPGIGGLLIYSVTNLDYNTLVACVMAIAAAFVVFSTLVELAYRVVDPRIRRA
jgi:ABC-type dipeptide/oligopeptide/nickel transport system permease component